MHKPECRVDWHYGKYPSVAACPNAQSLSHEFNLNLTLPAIEFHANCAKLRV